MSVDSERSTASPSTDKINPDWNRWLARDASGKLREISPAARRLGERATVKREPMSAYVQRLAARLGFDPEVLAEKISDDTMRRTKYPMLEHVLPDGTRQFTHDVGIIRDGVRALLATDRAYGDIKPNGSPRDGAGRFVPKR